MRRFKIEPELRDRIKAVAAAEERPTGHWMAIALDMMSRRGVPGLPAGQALTDGDLVTVGVQIDDDTADRIKAAAADDRRSVSAWCRRALRRAVAEAEAETTGAA